MFEESVAATIPSSSSVWQSMNSFFTPTVLFVLLNIVIGTIALTHSLANQKQQQKHSQNDPNVHLARSPSILHRLKSINFYTHYRSHQDPQATHSFSQEHQVFEQTQQKDHVFQQADNRNHEETQAQFVFDEKDPKLVTGFQENLQNLVSQQAHQKTSQRNFQDQSFRRTHNQYHQETQTQFGFTGKDSNSDGFEQTHDTFGEKDSNFDGFGQAHDENVDGFESMDEVYSKLTGGGVGHFSRSKSDTEPSSGKVPPRVSERMKKSASSRSVFGHFKEDEIVVEARRPATVREASRVTDGDAVHEVDAKADDFINRFKQQLKLQRLDSIIRYKNMISGGRGK